MSYVLARIRGNSVRARKEYLISSDGQICAFENRAYLKNLEERKYVISI